jgi:hypothetical protein
MFKKMNKFENMMWNLPPLLYFMRKYKIYTVGGARRKWKK